MRGLALICLLLSRPVGAAPPRQAQALPDAGAAPASPDGSVPDSVTSENDPEDPNNVAQFPDLPGAETAPAPAPPPAPAPTPSPAEKPVLPMPAATTSPVPPITIENPNAEAQTAPPVAAASTLPVTEFPAPAEPTTTLLPGHQIIQDPKKSTFMAVGLGVGAAAAAAAGIATGVAAAVGKTKNVGLSPEPVQAGDTAIALDHIGDLQPGDVVTIDGEEMTVATVTRTDSVEQAEAEAYADNVATNPAEVTTAVPLVVTTTPAVAPAAVVPAAQAPVTPRRLDEQRRDHAGAQVRRMAGVVTFNAPMKTAHPSGASIQKEITRNGGTVNPPMNVMGNEIGAGRQFQTTEPPFRSSSGGSFDIFQANLSGVDGNVLGGFIISLLICLICCGGGAVMCCIFQNHRKRMMMVHGYPDYYDGEDGAPLMMPY